jgi:AcrR family transcriptional regulator
MSRRDAERNRGLVLAAARDLHAQHGEGLGMQDVARRAGVGVGTVYRHFATREELLEALGRPLYEEGLRLALTVRDEHEPAERFDVFIRTYAQALADRGVPGRCSWDGPAAQPVRAELRACIAAFVADGQAAGTLRGDLTREDASALLWSIAALVDAARATPAIWLRHLDLVLDGLRPGPPTPVGTPPVAPEAWDAFVRARA